MRLEETVAWGVPWDVPVTSGVLESRCCVEASFQQRISSLHGNKITPQAFPGRGEEQAGSNHHLRPWELIYETSFMNSQAGLNPYTGEREAGGLMGWVSAALKGHQQTPFRWDCHLSLAGSAEGVMNSVSL